MSVKLYDQDPHAKSFDAEVIACRYDEKKSLYAVELDRTAFFAEGGGQQADRGVLDGQTVATVQSYLDEALEEHICHYVKQPVTVGAKVHGELDYDYRFENMQQHSGEHILSGILYARKGYHNVGFHLGDEVTTLDFDGPLTPEEIRELEQEGNRRVYRNLPITVSYPSPEELALLDYRSKKELKGLVRIVKVGTEQEPLDVCACCAPHVRLTGEIGIIKIIRSENYKGGIRLTIVCGVRALRDYRKKHEDLSTMAADMSTSLGKVPESVTKMKRELTSASEKCARLNGMLNEYRVKEWSEKGKTENSLCLVLEDTDPVAARDLVNKLVPFFEGHVCVLLPGKEKEEFFFMAASQKEDMRQLAGELRKEWNARGGGSAAMIQGTVRENAEKLVGFFVKKRENSPNIR